MSDPRVSIIVASFGRPEWLARCLTALGQIAYPTFEIVIVADEAGQRAVAAHAHGARVKVLANYTPNIAETRNIGIAAAAGEVLAFIDDDAVPEPLWLRHHVDALNATGAAASVGFVRGRNGITFQSKAMVIDGNAESHDLPFDVGSFGLPNVPEGTALKLVGTNFTVRRTAALQLGGFDPAFRFYLDDSDFSRRLAQAGHRAVVVPDAEVHHAVAASHHRTSRRAPKALGDIGRSTAIFVQKHGDRPPEQIWNRMISRERARLVRHLTAGTCEPRDLAIGMSDLKAGWDDGLAYRGAGSTEISPQNTEFKHFSSQDWQNAHLRARFFSRAKARRDAAALVRSGRRVTLFSFSATTLRHHVRFVSSGHWEQTGGTFGPSVRSQPWFRWCSFANRVKEEAARVEKQGRMQDTAARGG